ncbi:MAG: O-antigen ligase family protein [Candidatus Moraniibacteriota bacterium]
MHNNVWSDLGIIKSFFILPSLFAISLAYINRQDKNSIDFYLKFYLLYSSALALASLPAFISGQFSYDQRISLIFQSPNQLAFPISLGYLISIYFLLSKNKSFLFFSILAILHFLAVFLTHSTGAIFSLIVLTLIFLLVKKYQKLPRKFFAILIISQILSLVFIINLSFFLDITSYNPFQNKNSLDSRAVIYLVSGKIIKENYLFGIGASGFQEKYLEKQPSLKPYPQWAVPHSHNFFSQIWLSFGLCGLLLFFGIIIQKNISLKNISTNNFKSVLILILLGYFLLHGLVDIPFWKNEMALFFWFLIFI